MANPEDMKSEEIEETAQEAEGIIEKAGKQIAEAKDDLIDMIAMLRAYAKGDYRSIQWSSVVAILAAIVYFVNPVDIVPDAIPGVGFTDDAGVIAFVAGMMKHELQRFRDFTNANVEVEVL